MNLKPLVLGAWVLGILSWVVLLAGVAAMQSDCGSSSYNSPLGSVANYNGPAGCDRFFNLPWWTVWYQFAVLLFVVVGVFGAPRRTKVAMVGLLCPVLVLLMLTADTFLYYNYIPDAQGLSRTRTTVAGAIISSVADFLLIIVIGLFSENDEDGGGDVESPYATGKSAAAQGYPGGTAYPTGPGTAPAGMTPGGVMRG